MCAFQEYFFQFGALSKACLTVIICGLALYITKYTQTPQISYIKYSTIAMLIIPILACLASIRYKTARVYCTYEGSLSYDDSSPETKIAVLAYSMCIVAPVYICIAADVLFSMLLFFRVKGLESQSQSQTSLADKVQLDKLVTRMQLYPIVVIFSWLPNSALYICSNAFGIKPMALRIIAVLSLGTSGIGISLNYFFHQKTFPPFIHRTFGNQIPERQSMLSPVGGEIESSIGSWSEMEASSSSGPMIRHTTLTVVEEARVSSDSQPSNNNVTERTYSLARNLLPRFDFRSNSSGTNNISQPSVTPQQSGETLPSHGFFS